MLFFRRKNVNLEHLSVLIKLAEQVVLALEQTARTSGSEKKRLALLLLADLMQAHGLDPPRLLLDTVIEAAVRLTR